jgi:hypothetical protein
MSIFACVGFVLFGLVRPRGVVGRSVLLLVVLITAVGVYFYVPGIMALAVNVVTYVIGWILGAIVEGVAVRKTADNYLKAHEDRCRTDR